MKGRTENRIDSIQFMFLVHTVPIGVGVLGLTRFVADKSGHDAALAILAAGIYPQLSILFMWLLLRRFRNAGIYDIHPQLMGKWLGKLFNLVFAFYCFFAFFLTLRTFVELVNTWLFPMTPVWGLTSLFLIPIVYSSVSGLRLLGRYAIAVFFLTIWIILLSYFPISEGTFSHILPIGTTGFQKIFQGTLMTGLSLLGFELMLVYYPYVDHKPDVLPAASIASWAVVLIYAVVGVITLMFFSLGQLKKTVWPMLTMFKHVQMPFIERFETIIIAIWLLHIVNTCGTYLWCGFEGLQKTFKAKKALVYTGIVVLTLIGSQVVEGRAMINMLSNILSKVGFYLMVGYPMLLWGLALLLRKKANPA